MNLRKEGETYLLTDLLRKEGWGSGSWQGHINFYEKQRMDLRALIALADSKGCPVSEWAREVANESPPNRPGYR